MSSLPTAPGAYVSVTAAPVVSNVSPSTGTFFVTGITTGGPVGKAVAVSSLAQFVYLFGARTTNGMVYDALDVFFREGGAQAYVSRVENSAAVAATITLQDTTVSPVATLTVTASGPGVWGNNLSVIVAAGSVTGTYTLSTVNNSVVVEQSPNLYTPADAVTWAVNSSNFLVITNLNDVNTATANPATGTFALTGGSETISSITETQWTTALTAFPPSLGPGQVAAPGHNTTAGWQALISHASANNRFALLDPQDTSTYTSLITQIASAQGGASDYSMFLAPWVTCPGVAQTTIASSPVSATRTVPPSALVAGLMARSDAVNSCNTPAAGGNGVAQFCIAPTQTYTQTNLGILNASQVNILQLINGQLMLMGYSSAATNPAWLDANNARLRMQIIEQGALILTTFLFQQIDGPGQLLSDIAGTLTSYFTTLWTQGALYGAAASDAFTVDMSPSTPAVLANNQIIAQVGLAMSPFAELIDLLVTKYPITAALPPVTSTAQ